MIINSVYSPYYIAGFDRGTNSVPGAEPRTRPVSETDIPGDKYLHSGVTTIHTNHRAYLL